MKKVAYYVLLVLTAFVVLFIISGILGGEPSFFRIMIVFAITGAISPLLKKMIGIDDDK